MSDTPRVSPHGHEGVAEPVRDWVRARSPPVHPHGAVLGTRMVCEPSCKAVVATQVLGASWRRADRETEDGCEAQDPSLRDRVRGA